MRPRLRPRIQFPPGSVEATDAIPFERISSIKAQLEVDFWKHILMPLKSGLLSEVNFSSMINLKKCENFYSIFKYFFRQNIYSSKTVFVKIFIILKLFSLKLFFRRILFRQNYFLSKTLSINIYS
jgi:hypothetical protein